MNGVGRHFGPEFYRPLNPYPTGNRHFLLIDNVIRFDDPLELGLAEIPDVRVIAGRARGLWIHVYRSLDDDRQRYFYDHIVLLDRMAWEANLPIPARERARARETQMFVQGERQREISFIFYLLSMVLALFVFFKNIDDIVHFGPGPR